MITKVSKNEILSQGQNQSISFAKQNEKKKSNVSNVSNRKNKLQNEPVQDELVKRNNVASPKVTTQQAKSNNWGLITGLGGIGVASVAIALASRKTKSSSSAVSKAAEESIDALKKQAQEMTEVIEHLTKSPESRDFTDYLKYPQTDPMKEALNQYVETALKEGKVTKHQLHVDKAPEEFKAGMMAVKAKPFEELTITRSDKTKVNMVDYLQDLASKKMYQVGIKDITQEPRNGRSHVLWLPTAEDLKITKNGGLADVPPQLSEAMVKYDVASPVIISPFYKEDISLVRRFADNTVHYTSKQLGGEPVEKLLEFKMDVYDGNKFDKKQLTIEVFQHIEKLKDANGKEKELKRILIGTDGAFDACYKYNEPLEEKERFGAIFSKAVYEFRKLVEDYDGKSVKDVQNFVKEDAKPFVKGDAQNVNLKTKLKALQPDATILNDWQAASIAALYRIQAPLETAAKKLDIKVAERLMDENVSLIMHNGMYKGDNSGLKSAQIINTLFGENAAGVIQNAKIKYKGDVKGPENVFVMQSVDKDGNKIGTKYNNLINSAIAYADVVIPVSSNYAKEIVAAPSAKALAETAENGQKLVLDRAAKSTMDIKTMLSERFNHNNLFGVTNGFASATTRLSLDNPDVVKLKDKIADHAEAYAKLSAAQKQEKVIKDGQEVLKYPEKLALTLDEALLDSYKFYDYADDAKINENINIKNENKQVFLPWLKEKLTTSDVANKFTLHGKPEHTNIDDITVDNIKDIPIILMGARVSDQKGFGEAKKAIIKLLNSYDQTYPGKQKPLIIIGGAAEDADVKFLKELKEELGEKGKRVIALNQNVPNPQLFPIADINLGPSLFEPCGLTQQQAKANFALTVYSKVGGHVDTIKEGTGIIVPIEEYSDKALKQAFDLYHNNKTEFNKMIDVASREDFNWIKVEKESGLLTGPSIEHAQLIGIHKEGWKPLNRTNGVAQ